MSNKKPKVLVVEDEKDLMFMYKEELIQKNFDVISAFEAKEAIELTKKERPDLILLDILLPKENGIFYLKKIREDPETSSIPVVAFSNYDDSDTIDEAKKLGVKEYLIKTEYTPLEIVKKLKKHIKENK